MHVVIFGLTISSSWGNGHATLWRSLMKVMLRRGYSVSFYERDVEYYSATRDLLELPDGGRLIFYRDFEEIREQARRDVEFADLAIATSYCPDGRAASRLILESRAAVRCFYDLDTPVTLDGLNRSREVEYLPESGLGDFDLVLSFTGGRALEELERQLGARVARPLYGSVDPDHHRPVTAEAELRSALSYLGTYAADRQEGVQRYLLDAAERLPEAFFLIGGAQYPEKFPWLRNVGFVRHLPPARHAAFFSSSRATLNVTRGVMAEYGYCPSGRMFEATACGAVLLSDQWEGIESFFEPGSELLTLSVTDDVVAALTLSDKELARIAQAGRERTLQDHTGERRVSELEDICHSLGDTSRKPASGPAMLTPMH